MWFTNNSLYHNALLSSQWAYCPMGLLSFDGCEFFLLCFVLLISYLSSKVEHLRQTFESAYFSLLPIQIIFFEFFCIYMYFTACTFLSWWQLKRVHLLWICFAISVFFLLSSPRLLQSFHASVLSVPWFWCFVLQFCHLNISSNISRAQSCAAELFKSNGNLGEETDTLTDI